MNLKSLCRDRNLEQISTAMLLYNKALGKVLPGLVRRREAEQRLFNKKSTVSTISKEKEKKEVYDMPTIKEGSKGKAVKVWQIILGFSGEDVDGIFGNQTRKSTEKWQKKHNLVVDGIVGNKTWKAGLESL